MSTPDQLSGRTVLVTGATGFIGWHLVQGLLSRGAVVHAVSRRAQTTPNENGVHWWCTDLSDIAGARRLLSHIQPELTFHLAGYVSGNRDAAMVLPTFSGNLVSTVNLLTAAMETGCARIVIAGSLEECQTVGGDQAPASPYAAAKLAASAYGRMFHALYGAPVVNARLFMVYGPGQRDLHKLVPYSILSLLRAQPVRLTSGRRLVDWIYVDDAVAGLMAAATVPMVEGKTWDLGSGECVSIERVVRTVAGLIDPACPLLFGALPDRPLEVVCAADAAATYSTLGWRATTSLDAGLRQTISWYRDQLLARSIDTSALDSRPGPSIETGAQ